MGLEADAGAVSEVKVGIDGAGDAAAPAAAIGPGPGRDAGLVGPDKKKKKKRGPRGGKQQRLTGDQRKKWPGSFAFTFSLLESRAVLAQVSFWNPSPFPCTLSREYFTINL